MRKARWRPLWDPRYSGSLLEGRTLAVIGLGSIGTAVAKRARGFDRNVIGVRRHPERGGEHAETIHGPTELHDVLGRADFAVLPTPITAETEKLLDAGAPRHMKPSAFLVDVARGQPMPRAIDLDLGY